MTHIQGSSGTKMPYPYFPLKQEYSWVVPSSLSAARHITKWTASKGSDVAQFTMCELEVDPDTWFVNYAKERCLPCMKTYLDTFFDGKVPTYSNWTASIVCEVCSEKFWTKTGYDSHKCSPLPKVYPTSHNFIKAARVLAYAAHADDQDKMGEPYRHHLLAVAEGVRILGGSDYAVAAAYMHDIIEDHSPRVTAKKLLDMGFPERVVDIVEAVTKRPSEEQGKYLDRVVAGGIDAMHVKLADLLHNMRHDRHSALPEATQMRMKKKYRPAIARLMMELGLIASQDDHDKLVATKPVGSTYVSSGSSGYPLKDKDGASWYQGSQFIKGDWVAGWTAPIARKIKSDAMHVAYELVDHTVRSAKGRQDYRLWTQGEWSNKVTFVGSTTTLAADSWTPAQESQHPKVEKKTKAVEQISSKK